MSNLMNAQSDPTIIDCEECNAPAGEPCRPLCVAAGQFYDEQLEQAWAPADAGCVAAGSVATVRCGNREHELGLSDEHHHHSVAQVRACCLQALVPSLEEELYEQHLDAIDAIPTCSICDASGHGYPGGMPCPLEVNEVQRYEEDAEERMFT